MQSRLMRFVPDWDDVWLVANSDHCGAHLTRKGAIIVKAPKYRRHDDLEKENRVLFVGIPDDMRAVPDKELAPLRLRQARWQRDTGMPVVFCSIWEARLLGTQPVIRALPLLTRSTFVNSQMRPSPLLRQWLAEWVGISPGALDILLEEWSGRKDIARLWRAWATVDAHAIMALQALQRIRKRVDEASPAQGRRVDFDMVYRVVDAAMQDMDAWLHHAGIAETEALPGLHDALLEPPCPGQPHEVVPVGAEAFREHVQRYVSVPLQERRRRLWMTTSERVMTAQKFDLCTIRDGYAGFEVGVKAAIKALLVLMVPTARQVVDAGVNRFKPAWPLLGAHGRFVQLALNLRRRPHGYWSWADAKRGMPREELRQAMADMRQRLQCRDGEMLLAVPARIDPRQKSTAEDLRLVRIHTHRHYTEDWRVGLERIIRSWQW